MAKRIEIAEKGKRIHDVSSERRRIDPEQFAAALNAEAVGARLAGGLDPISLAELGSDLLHRLRSTGGRPALVDATEYCRVPLSANDVASLEAIVSQVEKATGTKPSVGQIAGVIVRSYLASMQEK